MPERNPAPARVPHQQTLFRVIPFESIAPPPKAESPRRRRAPAEDPHRASPEPRALQAYSGQPKLDFPAPSITPVPAAEQAAKPAVQCEAPVASMRQRTTAAALDFALALLVAGIFLGIFGLYTREHLLGKLAAIIYLIALALIQIFYRLLAVILADRTPGSRMAGIRLLHFDGRPPSRSQRLLRLAACFLSLLPAGIGFIWALVDEEHLTFHDHISETFASPEQPRR
jgi:uncharacterized RDD family membrane protein YckC